MENAIQTVDTLPAQIEAEASKREQLAKYVRKNMVEGVDFYKLSIGGKMSKPSLSKPGSEKFMSLFHLRAEFIKDTDTWEMAGSQAGVLCYICKLYDKRGELVGEGRGSRKVEGGDVNKAVKMAQKSAQIDAVLRTGGLSDLFTQDLEDMPEARTEPKSEPKTYGKKQPASDEYIEFKRLIKELGRTLPGGDYDASNKIIKDLTGFALTKTNYPAINDVLRMKINEQAPKL